MGHIVYSQPMDNSSVFKEVNLQLSSNQMFDQIISLAQSISSDQLEINKKAYLIGLYIEFLFSQRMFTLKVLIKDLKEKNIMYSRSYIYFLPRFARLLKEYPKLLKSNFSINLFMSKINFIEQIVRKDEQFWKN
jgi:hypothetical protein